MATAKNKARRAKKTDAPSHDANIARLEKIIALMEASSLTELEYEDEDIEVVLVRHRRSPIIEELAQDD